MIRGSLYLFQKHQTSRFWKQTAESEAVARLLCWTNMVWGFIVIKLENGRFSSSDRPLYLSILVPLFLMKTGKMGFDMKAGRQYCILAIVAKQE